MPILNYTTTITAEKSVGEVQGILGKAGASMVSTEYADGKVVGVFFTLPTEYGARDFRLPVRGDGVFAALQKDSKVPASKKTMEQAERVAWRIAKDWLEAQVALVQAGMAQMDEVMLPYMLGAGGQTLFQAHRARQLELTTGDGQE